jgi:glycine cleavage system transcriptional repressor
MSRDTLLAVSVVGKDRPGIVAAVTKVLYELGCNLEDATSTILRGHFAFMLIVRAPAESDAAAVEDKLGPAAREMGLVATVGAVEEAGEGVVQPTHMVSVYGADRPGIVYRVAQKLADARANITDLTSRVIGSEDRPVYALMLEVAADPRSDLERGLVALKEELDVEVTVHPIEADVL